MRRNWLVALVAAVGMLSACGPLEEEEQVNAVAAAQLSVSPLANNQTRSLRVMTQNLYLGASLSEALTLPPRMIPLAVEATLRQLATTDFRLRAREIALAIEDASPDLVGLQEAELIRLELPSLIDPPRMQTDYDFLEILLVELEKLGLCYETAIIGEQTDVELPVGYTGLLARFTDRDVILARCGVTLANASARHYQHNLVVDVLGHQLPILRGWEQVDATTEAGTFRFVNTHLEPATLPAIVPIQLAQAAELLIALGTSPLPVALVGDFNSAADGSSTPTYGLVLEAGYADAWELAPDHRPGYTCCQAPDLSNRKSELSKRIDFVFVRDFAEPLRGSAFLVSDRVLPGFDLWPSDHAGVVAAFQLSESEPFDDLPEAPEVDPSIALPTVIR